MQWKTPISLLLVWLFLAKVFVVEAKTMQFMVDAEKFSISKPYCAKKDANKALEANFSQEALSNTLNLQAICTTPILLLEFVQFSTIGLSNWKVYQEPKLVHYSAYQELNLPPPKQ